MFKNRLDYIRQLFAPETDLLKNISLQAQNPDDRISIYPEEGKLLQLLIHLSGARKIVEIGTLNGYSTQWMTTALPEDGHVWTIEKDETRARCAKENLTPGRTTLLQGDALTVLPTIEQYGPFDLAFIDADKLNYTNYLDWAEKNVRKGGLIIGDNTFLFDAVWKDGPIDRVRETARQAMRDFNRRLADPEKYIGIMLPSEEGMTIGMKLF